MKLSLGTAIIVSAAAASCASLLACGDGGDATNEDSPVVTEGGTLPPQTDAGAPIDAAADVDAEAAAPRVCSDESFCHTTVPKVANVAQTLRGVWSDGAGAVWAVSEQGAILRYDSKPGTWTVHTKTKGALYAVWGSGPNDVWVGGDAGILHGTGASSAALVFTDVRAPGDGRAPIRSIWGTGASDVWAAGGTFGVPYVARVLHYGSDGAGGIAWALDGASGMPIDFARVWGSTSSGVWLAGIRTDPTTFMNEVAVVRRNTGTTKFSDVVIPRDPQAPKGVGQIDKLYDANATTDGTMWVLGRTNTSKPAYVRGTTTDGVTFTWSFEQHGPSVGPLPAFVGGAAANDAWIGGEYGRLRHFDGTTWTQAQTTITTFPEIAPLYAMNIRGQDLWVVGEGIAMHRDPARKN